MPDTSEYFINREFSWLQFNRRVLEEALDESNPVLERVKFLAIASTNLDEFFEVRVAGTMELVDAGLPTENPGSLTPHDELAVIRREARQVHADMHRCWREKLVPALATKGIQFLEVRDVDADQRVWLREYFVREVYPVLTPLAVDPAHPFPSLLNKSLNVAVLLLDSRRTPPVNRIAVVQVPRVLSRLVRMPNKDGRHQYVLMADMVREHIDLLFPGLTVLHVSSFRVTRDGNLDVEDDQGEDLMAAVERELSKRRRGEPVRLEVRNPHPELVARFLEAFDLDPADVYVCDGPVNLGRLMELYRTEDGPGLKDPPFTPVKLHEWVSADHMFSTLRVGDILLHHPYESFDNVEDLVRFSARDPRVLAIKMTIYRTGDDSSIMHSLLLAAENRKQVTVVVELQARFDEEANIRWAKRMEKAGVHVVYGIVGLKTHAKAVLIVRREEDGLRRYCHLGTGNYNAVTSRTYTDIGLLTARETLCHDVAEMFNMITGYMRVPDMSQLVVAPFMLRKSLLGWIHREAAHASEGRPARIRAKLNALVDSEIIRALYSASQASVQIDLFVRGICCLKPGIPGLSENIRVTSIVDRFLEHSRMFIFENAGTPEVWVASADWMTRNLDRRLEACFPILDPALRQRAIEEIFAFSSKDDVKARRILPDGTYERIKSTRDGEGFRSQKEFLEVSRNRAIARAKMAEEPVAKVLKKKTKRNKERRQ